MNTNNSGTQATRLSLRTQEINELLGKSPNYLISWGTTWFLAIVLGLFVVTAYVKYPQTISGTISISLSGKNNEAAPVKCVARFKEEFAGKLIKGQQASINIKSHPSQEFGVLTARVDSVYPKLNNGHCEVLVSIVSLYTTNKVNLAGSFSNLNGTISIVVREETLLKRLLSRK